MNTLILVTNIFIAIQEMSIANGNIYYKIDEYYNPSSAKRDTLREDIKALYPEIKEYTSEPIDTIISISYITDYMKVLFDTIGHNKRVFVEDGAYDYLSDGLEYKEYKTGYDLYAFRPEQVRCKAYKSIKPLHVNMSNVTEAYMKRFKVLTKIDRDAIILFTTPMKDFSYDSTSELIGYIERHYPDKTVLIKRHPRDNRRFTSDIINLCFCPNNIPGQIVCELFKGKKLFEYPSTIAFMSDKDSNITIITYKDLEKESYWKAIKQAKDFFDFEIVDSKE